MVTDSMTSWGLQEINRLLFGGPTRCMSVTTDGAYLLQCALAPGHANVHRARSLPWEAERVWYASPLSAFRYTALECMARDARAAQILDGSSMPQIAIRRTASWKVY